MKYIKKFENLNKYNVGDYILLSECDDYSVESDAKIIELHPGRSRNSYDIEVFGSDGEFIETFVFEDEIERLLNKDEIKNFELKKSAKKYNI